jgi:tetratricopeptide (TPR) repeat protein
LLLRLFAGSIGLAGGCGMASVFLSYDRDDSDRARHFAHALEKAGHQVWWDLHVRSGAQFTKVIEEALKAADVVVVLWSRYAVDSAWVRDEAAAGRDTNRLVPVTIDGTEPPLGFRQFQTIDLSRWKGRGAPVQLRTLLADIESTAAAPEAGPSSRPVPKAAPPRQREYLRLKSWLIVALIIGLAFVILGLAIGRPWETTRSDIPTVAVAAADSSPLSQDMARNLLVKLGSLPVEPGAAVRLPDNIGPTPADIRLAVNGSREGNLVRANVSLISGQDKTMLWSKDFERTAADRSALEDSIASSAARALRCARDEASGEYGRLSEDLRAIYVNACEALTDTVSDADSIIPGLRHITEKAPRFRPAWAKLLTAEGDLASSLPLDSDQSRSVRAALSKDAAAARKVDPDMAETTLSELVIHPGLPPAVAMPIVDKAKQQDPQNPVVLIARAVELGAVGRMEEAREETEAAAKLDPLSPATAVNLIFATSFSGKVDKARAELASAKRLWPDLPAVREAEYELTLRYTNDWEKMSREMGYIGPGFEIYSRARLHPSDANVAAYMAFMHKPENLKRMPFALQGLGEIDRPNEFYQLLAEVGDGGILARDRSILFRPWMAPIRRDPRFMVLAKRLGLVDYWLKSGQWPDFCADAQLKYDCRTEAAKLAS